MLERRLMIITTVAAVAPTIIAASIFNLDKKTAALFWIALSFAAFLIARVVFVHLGKKRRWEWCAANGTIQSCEFDSSFKQTQYYRCAYVFWPGDTRQGGTFLIYESFSIPDERVDEISKALIGGTVRVRYDPNDCTRSMVEDTKVMSWNVMND